MTKGEINLLYVEVEKLLNEICSFLKEEITGGHISYNGRSIANRLIEKSKQQLQTISIITTTDSADCTSEPYVDMQNYKVNQEEEEEPSEVYSDISLLEEIITTPPTNEEYVACPYASLPAVRITEGKNGHIYRKERIFFFEQHRKVYAAVYQSWLLIYMNENSVKPCQMFDLTHCEAKPTTMPVKSTKKRELKRSFDLSSFNEAKKYDFIALTTKDMLQWVDAINKQSEKLVSKRDLPPVPESPGALSNKSLSVSTESMNDYEPLTEYQLKQKKFDEQSSEAENQKIIEKPSVPLPPRNKNLTASQGSTPRVPSQESIGSTYDSVGPGILTQSEATLSSFSGDDSDTVYDNPTEIQKRKPPPPLFITAQNNLDSNVTASNENGVNNQDLKRDDDDDIYDYLEKPKAVVKPQSSDLVNSTPSNTQNLDAKKQNESELVKSKLSLRPRMLSLRRKRKDA